MESYISDTFEAALLLALHPGSSICINIQELQDSGGVSFRPVSTFKCIVWVCQIKEKIFDCNFFKNH